MLGLNVWRFEGRSVLSLTNGDLRLLVQQRSGSVLFLVQQCSEDPGHPPAIITSGVRESVREAMVDAEKAAARLITAQRRSGHAANGTETARLHAS